MADLLAQSGKLVAPFGSAAAIRKLDRETAARSIPVEISGAVTFTARNGFILDDGQTAIFVSTQDAQKRDQSPQQDFDGMPSIGMKLSVSGVTAIGGFAPVVIPNQIRFLGIALLPSIKTVTAPELHTGRYDCERVRIRGIVQTVDFTTQNLGAVQMEVASTGAHFVAYAATPAGFEPSKLIDAEVDLSGIALTFFNDRAEIVGARIQLQGIEDVSIIQSAQEDPFSVPAATMNALLPFSPEAPSLHRSKVAGVVTLYRQGAPFYIQSGPSALRISSRSTIQLQPGDQIEASGFLELRTAFAEMCEAVVRKTGTEKLPIPIPSTYPEVLHPQTPSQEKTTRSDLDG